MSKIYDLLNSMIAKIKGIEKDLKDLPTTLPNPNVLTFTGAATGTYDGSAPLTVNIPEGGNTEGGGGLTEVYLGEFSIPENTQKWIISQDANGNPFEAKEAWIFLKACVLYDTTGSEGNKFIKITDGKGNYGEAILQTFTAIRHVKGAGFDSLTPDYGYMTLHIKIVNGKCVMEGWGGGSSTNLYATAYNTVSTKGSNYLGEYFSSIEFSCYSQYCAIAKGSTATITIVR